MYPEYIIIIIIVCKQGRVISILYRYKITEWTCYNIHCKYPLDFPYLDFLVHSSAYNMVLLLLLYMHSWTLIQPTDYNNNIVITPTIMTLYMHM